MSIQGKIIFCLLVLVCQSVSATAAEKSHKNLSDRFLKPVYHKLHQIWTEGDTDIYFSGYAWHNRFTYSPERIRTYNEAAWGGGLGRGLFDAKGDWRGLYAIAFLDSHRHLEPAVGYCFLKVAKLSTNLRAGIGYSVLVTSRTDLYDGIPFPGVLPWGSIFYKKVALSAAYVPGAIGTGNVLFIIGRYTF